MVGEIKMKKLSQLIIIIIYEFLVGKILCRTKQATNSEQQTPNERESWSWSLRVGSSAAVGVDQYAAYACIPSSVSRLRINT